MSDVLLTEFIKGKIADAEKAVAYRAESEKVWKSGTDASWAAAADMHSSTVGKRHTKAERLALSRMEGRILIKCRRELDLYQQVLKVLESY